MRRAAVAIAASTTQRKMGTRLTGARTLLYAQQLARRDQSDVWRCCPVRDCFAGTQDRANYLYRNLTLASDSGEGGSVDELTLKKHRLLLDLVALEAEFGRVLMLNAEPPLIPENQQVSQELVAAHELVKGLIARLQG